MAGSRFISADFLATPKKIEVTLKTDLMFMWRLKVLVFMNRVKPAVLLFLAFMLS